MPQKGKTGHIKVKSAAMNPVQKKRVNISSLTLLPTAMLEIFAFAHSELTNDVESVQSMLKIRL